MQELKIDLREMNSWFQERFKGKDLITFEELLSDYEDTIFEIERLEEEIEDIKQDIKDNYRQIPVSEQVEVYDRDFI